MRRISFLFLATIGLLACGDNSSRQPGTGDSIDSASTAPLTSPTYNPTVEADSAADDMNLDSSRVNDSGTNGSGAGGAGDRTPADNNR